MKKQLVVAVAAVMMVAMAGLASAGVIKNSKHDLSTTTAGGTLEICVFCHTPHGGNASNGPLWNRSGNTSSFTMYSIQATTNTAVAGNMSVGSKGCMTCHDGVTAIAQFINGPGNPDQTVNVIGAANGVIVNGVMAPSSLSNIGGGGGDLTNDHPIAIVYDINVATTLNALNNVANLQTVMVKASNRVDGQNNFSKVQCESCHNVHDPAYPPFLRISNSSSALCLACHNK